MKSKKELSKMLQVSSLILAGTGILFSVSLSAFGEALPTCVGIEACAAIQTPKAPFGPNGPIWSLAARSAVNGSIYPHRQIEVWFDSVTKLYWGDVLDPPQQLAGWSQACKIGFDCRGANRFAVMVQQDSSAKQAACAESDEGKRASANGLNSTKKFRLPTAEEYVQADKDGAGLVLPKAARTQFWTATGIDDSNAEAFAFGSSGGAGSTATLVKSYQLRVRCVSQ